MAKVELPLMSFEAKGTLLDLLTFFRKNGKNFLKYQKKQVDYTNTARNVARANFSKSSSWWSLLSSSDKLLFEDNYSPINPRSRFLQVALNYGVRFGAVQKSGQNVSVYDGDDVSVNFGVPYASTRYVDNSDGTIFDRTTGLYWVKDMSQLPAPFGDLSNPLQDTLWNFIGGLSGLSYAGYSDWRIPNANELLSIINFGRIAPCIGENVSSSAPFTKVQNQKYLSSTIYNDSNTTPETMSIYYLDMSNLGFFYQRSNIAGYTILVRG